MPRIISRLLLYHTGYLLGFCVVLNVFFQVVGIQSFISPLILSTPSKCKTPACFGHPRDILIFYILRDIHSFCNNDFNLNALFLSNIYIVVSFKAILSWMQKEDQYA